MCNDIDELCTIRKKVQSIRNFYEIIFLIIAKIIELFQHNKKALKSYEMSAFIIYKSFVDYKCVTLELISFVLPAFQ